MTTQWLDALTSLTAPWKQSVNGSVVRLLPVQHRQPPDRSSAASEDVHLASATGSDGARQKAGLPDRGHDDGPLCVAHLTAHISRQAGGFFWSVRRLVGSLNERAELEAVVVGLLDAQAPEDGRIWDDVRPLLCPQWGPRALGYAPGFARRLVDLSPDLLHSHGLWMYHSAVTARWAKRWQRPTIVSPRGMLDPWALEQGRWKKRLARIMFEDRNLGSAGCLHATSEAEAAHIRRFGISRPIAIVPNGIDIPERLAPVPQGSFRRLLFLSRIHPKKGLPFLLRAWSRLERRHPDWELVVAGPDERGHRAEMERLAIELSLSRVRFTGPAYGIEKEQLFASASLFVLPTHTENFGLAVAEALARELPVVTTKGAPWRGLETHGCGWWTELDVDPLARALDEAMRLPENERQAMGARGRIWMQQDFAWPRVACDMATIYDWLRGGGIPPANVVTD